MPERFTGKDVLLEAGPISGHLKTIEIMVKKEKWDAPSSDSDVPNRGTKNFDASIKISGWDTDANDGTDISALIVILLNNWQLETLDFTDTAATPAAKLPPIFWTKFPLETWGIDEVNGKDYSQNPADWSVTLSPGNSDLIEAP